MSARGAVGRVQKEVLPNADLAEVTSVREPTGCSCDRTEYAGIPGLPLRPGCILARSNHWQDARWHDRPLEWSGRTTLRIHGLRNAGRSVAVLIPPDRPDELSYLLDRIQTGDVGRTFPDDTATEERDDSRCGDHRHPCCQI